MSYNVWVHCDSYLPFGMQSDNVAMAPNGDIYFREALYRHYFSEDFPEFKHLFIHELTHVWQHQNGMWVRTRGLFSNFVDYNYSLDRKKKLSDYGMEQQASIVADYAGLIKGIQRDYVRIDNKIDPNTIESIYRSVLPNSIL